MLQEPGFTFVGADRIRQLHGFNARVPQDPLDPGADIAGAGLAYVDQNSAIVFQFVLAVLDQPLLLG